jgi:hypothetical protein
VLPALPTNPPELVLGELDEYDATEQQEHRLKDLLIIHVAGLRSQTA